MKLRVPLAGAALVAAALTACGEDMRSDFEGSADGGAASDGGPGFPGDGSVGAVSGVVILHAAAFPPFRLCFENYPELAPQPDTALMPEANVVGVEVGSVIRIGSLEKPPGKIYVIDQREVRATPRDPLDRKCGTLIADTDFAIDRKYQLAGEIMTPLGVDRVDVLAITGCGGGAWLNELKISPDDCTSWDPTTGSLQARTVELLPSVVATETSLPVQIVHMSSLLDAKRAPGEEIDVTFGALEPSAGRRLGQSVATSPPLFEAGAPTTLAVEQATEAVFGSHGFRIALRPSSEAGDGGTGVDEDAGATFFVDQSLAEVQELSFPQTVPTTYYQAASNYALILLGDPRVVRTYDDGGANPSYDARRGVHLLAVPVKAETDAGTEPDGDVTIPYTNDGG